MIPRSRTTFAGCPWRANCMATWLPSNVGKRANPDFKSLMPMAQDTRKPMFLLKPADGAIGGQAAAVQDCYAQFRDLALRISAEIP